MTLFALWPSQQWQHFKQKDRYNHVQWDKSSFLKIVSHTFSFLSHLDCKQKHRRTTHPSSHPPLSLQYYDHQHLQRPVLSFQLQTGYLFKPSLLERNLFVTYCFLKSITFGKYQRLSPVRFWTKTKCSKTTMRSFSLCKPVMDYEPSAEEKTNKIRWFLHC